MACGIWLLAVTRHTAVGICEPGGESNTITGKRISILMVEDSVGAFQAGRAFAIAKVAIGAEVLTVNIYIAGGIQ